MPAIKTRIWQGGVAGITGVSLAPLRHPGEPESDPPSDDVGRASMTEVKETHETEPTPQTPEHDLALLSASELETRIEPAAGDADTRPIKQTRTLPGLGDPAPNEPAALETAPRDWWAARTEQEREAHQRMASTRIMPIEELLGRGAPVSGPTAAEPAPSEPVSAISTPASVLQSAARIPALSVDNLDEGLELSAQRASAASTRRLRIALLLASCGVAAFMCFVPAGSMAPSPTPAHASETNNLQARSEAHTANARGTPAPAAASASGESSPARRAAILPTPAASSARDSLAPPAAGLQRAAIDALVAGDYTRAEQLYGELSRTAPASVAYGEAARILSQRAGAH